MFLARSCKAKILLPTPDGKTRIEVVAPSTKPQVVPLEQTSLSVGSVNLRKVPKATIDGEIVKEHTVLVGKYAEDKLLVLRVFAKLRVDTQVDIFYVPVGMMFPPFDIRFHSVASDPNADDAYVKKPRVSLYTGSDVIATLLGREARTCELLKLHPHPNIAEYRGVVHDQQTRIIGLCFKKYKRTLFQLGHAAQQPLKVDAWLRDIRRAIDHMHSLGICHNDVMPGNIMLDDDDNAVLIDFDGAYADNAIPQGAHKRGSHGWRVPDFKMSCKSNDFYGFNLVEKYLRERELKLLSS